MSDTVEICPECGSTNLRNTVGHHLGPETGHDGNACNNCEATFAEPDVRERKHDNETRSGLAAKLADPEVRDPKDIVTDGGLKPVEEIGVPKDAGESWGDAARRLRGDSDGKHECVCGAAYHSRRAALRCCSERFEELSLSDIRFMSTKSDSSDANTEVQQ